MYCIFDTETTGLVNRQAPPNHPCQPRILQFAAIMLDDKLEQSGELSFMIRQPPGTTIHPKAAEAHGLSIDQVNCLGIEIGDAYQRIKDFTADGKFWTGFNVDFDVLALRALCAQAGQPDLIYQRQIFCIMRSMTDHVRLPGKFGFKFPKLQEAHVFCTGAEFDGAHDALADVRATVAIAQWLHRNGHWPVQQLQLAL